ncbi:MAG TPA: DUF3618 domain-containing protein [Euzebyales bacterium]
MTPPPPADAADADDLRAREAAARREHLAERRDDPEAIRRDIAHTRRDMEGTIEAINDRVNPSRVYERRSGRARQRWNRLKSSIMGSDDSSWSTDPSSSWADRTPDVDVSGRARQAKAAISDAPDATKRRTRGNPLTAGMIAFGVGALIGGALPESEAERRVVGEADRHLDIEGTRQRLTDRAQQVGDDVRSSAQEAAQDLKGSAQDAAHDVRDDARREGERVREDAQQAGRRARHES